LQLFATARKTVESQLFFDVTTCLCLFPSATSCLLSAS
jgi:hypothetical protein